MLSLDLKFRYSSIVEYDYNSSSCTGGCDDYCRCSMIIDKRITKVKPLKVFNELKVTGVEKQEDYKFRKILGFILLKNFIKKAEFEVETCGGYYGEEVSGVRLVNPYDIELLIRGFNKLHEDPDEQLLYVLNKEYGYVLPRIKDLKGWSYKEVELGSIGFSEEVLMRTSADIVDGYAEFMFFNEGNFNHKERNLLPGIICDNNNRIVDGYHRLAACKTNIEDTKKISIISPD